MLENRLEVMCQKKPLVIVTNGDKVVIKLSRKYYLKCHIGCVCGMWRRMWPIMWTMKIWTPCSRDGCTQTWRLRNLRQIERRRLRSLGWSIVCWPTKCMRREKCGQSTCAINFVLDFERHHIMRELMHSSTSSTSQPTVYLRWSRT